MTKKEELFLGVVMLIFCAVVYALTLPMKSVDTLYIKIVLTLFTVLSIIQIYKNRPVKDDAAPSDKNKKAFMSWKQHMTVLMILAYVGLFYVVGFAVASVIFMIACPIFLGYKKYPIVLAIALASTGLIYYVFFEYLKIMPIPGILFG